jgi:hypothetical protein
MVSRAPALPGRQSTALRRVEMLTALRMCCEALSTTGRQTFIDKAARGTLDALRAPSSRRRSV